jgi:hypothetical protein
MVARASLLDVQPQFEAVAARAPGDLQQKHFIRISDPRSDTSLLLGNVYQFQASQQENQMAMLDLIRQVLTRWSEHAPHLIVIGWDWNTTCRPRVGSYAEMLVTRSADAWLEEWSRQEGLACPTSSHATWQSINESHYAVLDSFFWLSKTDLTLRKDYWQVSVILSYPVSA